MSADKRKPQKAVLVAKVVGKGKTRELYAISGEGQGAKPLPDNAAGEWHEGHGLPNPVKRSGSVPAGGLGPATRAKTPGRYRKGEVVKRPGVFRESALKVTDVVAFNTRSEPFFVAWLSLLIEASGGKGVELAKIYQNGAFDLDVQIDTIKRYVWKYTADRAPFKSEGGVVKFREE